METVWYSKKPKEPTKCTQPTDIPNWIKELMKYGIAADRTDKFDLYDEYVVFGFIRDELNNSPQCQVKEIANLCLLYNDLREILVDVQNNDKGIKFKINALKQTVLQTIKKKKKKRDEDDGGFWKYGSIPIEINNLHKYQQNIKFKINKSQKSIYQTSQKCIIGITHNRNLKKMDCTETVISLGNNSTSYEFIPNDNPSFYCIYDGNVRHNESMFIDINIKTMDNFLCVQSWMICGYDCNGEKKTVDVLDSLVGFKQIEFKNFDKQKVYYFAIYFPFKDGAISFAEKGIEKIQECCRNYTTYKLEHKYDYLFMMTALKRFESTYELSIPSTIKENIYKYFYSFVVGNVVDVKCHALVEGWCKAKIIKHKLPSQQILETADVEDDRVEFEALYPYHGKHQHMNGKSKWIFIGDNSICHCNGVCSNNDHLITLPNQHTQSKLYWTETKLALDGVKQRMDQLARRRKF